MKIAQIVKDIIGKAETAALEDKLAILKDKWLLTITKRFISWHVTDKELATNDLWLKVIASDPTPNKQYLQWIIQKCLGNPKWIKKPGRQYVEDLNELRANLDFYNTLKMKNKLPAEYRDINKAQSDDMLSVIVVPIRNQMEKDEEELLSKSGKAKAIEQLFYDNDGATLVHNSAALKVVIPLTHEASMYFGKNTRWCTTMRDDPLTFKQYMEEGDLYIILHKSTNRRWQFHFPDRQYMNEEDELISWHKFMAEPFWTELINIDSMQTAANENGCVPFQKKYTNAQANMWWDDEVESISPDDNHIAEFHDGLSNESKLHIMRSMIRTKFPFLSVMDYIEEHFFPNPSQISPKYKIDFMQEVVLQQAAGNYVLIPIQKMWPSRDYPVELFRLIVNATNLRNKGTLLVSMRMTDDQWLYFIQGKDGVIFINDYMRSKKNNLNRYAAYKFLFSHITDNKRRGSLIKSYFGNADEIKTAVQAMYDGKYIDDKTYAYMKAI